jgi:thiamine phosphate synthase YjbQ (UPF0047 family)
MMKKTLFLAMLLVFSANITAPVLAKETNEAVIQDFRRHQAKKNPHHKKTTHKKASKTERVPMAKLRNCHQRRFWVAPNRIREAKVCEIVK